MVGMQAGKLKTTPKWRISGVRTAKSYPLLRFCNGIIHPPAFRDRQNTARRPEGMISLSGEKLPAEWQTPQDTYIGGTDSFDVRWLSCHETGTKGATLSALPVRMGFDISS